MSIGTGYIYNQRGDVVLTDRSGTTRNVHSNYKPFIAYKGVTTRITFFIRGEDGKPVQLHDKQIVATAIKQNVGTIGFVKQLVTVTPETGKCELILTASDTFDIDFGMYSLMLNYTDLSGETTAIYMNKDARIEFVLEINDNPIPDSKVSNDIVTFNPDVEDETISLSNMVAGSAQSNNSSSFSTVVVYSTAATGTVTLEASLETSPTSTDWFVVDPVIEMTEQTGTFPYTYEGNFVWVRFRTVITSGSIDKISILY